MPVLEDVTDERISEYLNSVHNSVHMQLATLLVSKPGDTRLVLYLQGLMRAVGEETEFRQADVANTRLFDTLAVPGTVGSQDVMLMRTQFGHTTSARLLDRWPAIAEAAGFDTMGEMPANFPYSIVVMQGLAGVDATTRQAFLVQFRDTYPRVATEHVQKVAMDLAQMGLRIAGEFEDEDANSLTPGGLVDAMESNAGLQAMVSTKLSDDIRTGVRLQREAMNTMQAHMGLIGQGKVDLDGEVDIVQPGLSPFR